MLINFKAHDSSVLLLCLNNATYVDILVRVLLWLAKKIKMVTTQSNTKTSFIVCNHIIDYLIETVIINSVLSKVAQSICFCKLYTNVTTVNIPDCKQDI